MKTYGGPMVKEFGTIFGIVTCTENVHHHEILNVKLIPSILKLIDVASANLFHLQDHRFVNFSITGHFEYFCDKILRKLKISLSVYPLWYI